MGFEEVWKPVAGYESFYEVSNTGKVRSFDRQVWNGKAYYNKKGRELTLTKTSTGYWKIDLTKDKTKKSYKVHRLVAAAFIPIVEGKTLINHIDGDPLNNNVANLEWCTQSENMKHAAEMQLIPNNFNLHIDEIIDDYLTNHKTFRELSEKYQCSATSIIKLFKERGIKTRNISEAKNKYKIDKQELINDFKAGKRNVDLAKKYRTSSVLIGTYKYKWKKGELA